MLKIEQTVSQVVVRNRSEKQTWKVLARVWPSSAQSLFWKGGVYVYTKKTKNQKYIKTTNRKKSGI